MLSNFSTFSKQMIKMVKKIGMGHGRRSKGDETDDHQYDLSRTNSYDFEPGLGRDTEVIYYRERHLVPIDDVRQGIVTFSFLLETSAPGTIPDPLLIAALLDLVSILLNVCSCNPSIFTSQDRRSSSVENKAKWPIKINKKSMIIGYISSSTHIICSTNCYVYFTCKIRRQLVNFCQTVTEMVTGYLKMMKSIIFACRQLKEVFSYP